jgi:hypothetical protein
MNFEAMDFGLKVCNLLGTMVVGVYVWLSNRNRVTNERITALQEHTDNGITGVRVDSAHRIDDLDRAIEARLDRHGNQLAQLEAHRQNAPGHNDLKRLHERIDGFSSDIARLEGNFVGAINGITGQLAGVQRTVDLLNDYLLHQKT